MDAMHFFGKDFAGASDTKAEDRAAMRGAVLLAVLSVVATLGVILALSWAGVTPTAVDEAQPVPGLEQGMKGP